MGRLFVYKQAYSEGLGPSYSPSPAKEGGTFFTPIIPPPAGERRCAMSSWLYEHRDQLDGLHPLVEVAHWATVSHVPPEDQDDVEQEVVISLMQTVEKYGNKGKSYLWAVARHRIYAYLRREYKRKRLCYSYESEKEERAGGTWMFSHDGNADARFDAKVTLATLPERLIKIGHKILNGGKLSEADQSYWRRQKAKLNCRRYANRLSNWEKRRVLRLHRDGMSMCKIARTMGRSNRTVMRVLAGNHPVTRQDWLTKLKMAAKERDELIRHAYFADGMNISQIAREFHHDRGMVRKAIRESKLGEGQLCPERR